MNRCTRCGYGYLPGQVFCLNCGAYLKGAGEDAPQNAPPSEQSQSGYQQPPQQPRAFQPEQPYQPHPPHQAPYSQHPQYKAPLEVQPANRILVGVLALFLGGFGVQFFVMKKWAQAVVSLLFCWTGLPIVVGVLQGIRILCLSNEEFAEIYYDIPMNTPFPSEYAQPPHPHSFY